MVIGATAGVNEPVEERRRSSFPRYTGRTKGLTPEQVKAKRANRKKNKAAGKSRVKNKGR
jgi:hypothetical protein